MTILHPNCPTIFKAKERRFVKREANPNRWLIASNCHHLRMPIVVKVGDEQSVRHIGQLGEEFPLKAERQLGSPKSEGKERNEDDGENQNAFSHLPSPLHLKRWLSFAIASLHHFTH